jgi:crotonobetainyl-CoA:carnitine CoA-transferase CaiB-like acyl-CoA transferase
MRLGHALPDGVGGIAGALTALRGLRARDQHGHGGWYDVSQLEVYAALAGEDILTASLTGDRMAPIGNRSRTNAIQGVFACRGDDQWIAIRLNGQADVKRFVANSCLSSLLQLAQSTPRDDMAIEALIAAYTSDKNKFKLAQRLQSAGLEAVPVYTADELAADPHVIAREILVEIDCGARRCVLPGSPLHSSPALVDPHGRAPRFGEHTDEVASKK